MSLRIEAIKLPGEILNSVNHVARVVTDHPTQRLLRPILDPARRVADQFDEIDREMWVTDIIEVLLNKHGESTVLFEEAARLNLDQQAHLVLELFDNGWKNSGRKDAIPILINGLIDLPKDNQREQAQLLLRQVRQGLKAPNRRDDRTAQIVLRRIPKKVPPSVSSYASDLRFLELE